MTSCTAIRWPAADCAQLQLPDRFASGQLRAGDALVLSGSFGRKHPGIKAASRRQQRRSLPLGTRPGVRPDARSASSSSAERPRRLSQGDGWYWCDAVVRAGRSDLNTDSRIPQGKRASRRREIDHARSRSGPVLWWGWVARPDTAGVGGMDGSAWRGILLSQRPWSPGWLGVSDGVGAGVCGVAPSTSCCSRVMPF